MTSPFDPDYTPVIPGPTRCERAAAKTSRRMSDLNQKKLDRFGPSLGSALSTEEKQAARDKDRAIRAGRRV